MKIEDRLELFENQLSKIQDYTIRRVVALELTRVPDKMFTNPGSKNHHPFPVRGSKGLIIHIFYTLNVLDMYVRSYREGRFTQGEIDYARAALILHDAFKYGSDGLAEKIQKDHPESYASYLRSRIDSVAPALKEVYQNLATLIEHHHGIWSNTPYPNDPTPTMELVHYCDYIASKLHKIEDISADMPEYKPLLSQSV